MDLQALYQSIVDFWDNVSPILLAHLVFILAWAWSQEKSFDLLNGIEKILNSNSYKRWDKVFTEFDLMSKIPFILLVLLFIYFAIMSNVLHFVAGGFLSPLAIVYTETEFWQETNDSGVTHDLMQLASYQSNTDSHISDIYDLKIQKLEEYKNQYPERYQSRIVWVNKLREQWVKYYQISIILFAIFLIRTVLSVKNKSKSLIKKRLIFVLVLFLFAIFFSRYQAEYYSEKMVRAELGFVSQALKSDLTIQDKKLSDKEVGLFECNLVADRERFKTEKPHDFWLSRFIEDFVAREFKRNSDHPWESSNTCPPI